jgi:hypothetical protein
MFGSFLPLDSTLNHLSTFLSKHLLNFVIREIMGSTYGLDVGHLEIELDRMLCLVSSCIPFLTSVRVQWNKSGIYLPA